MLKFEPLFKLEAEVAPPIEFGVTPGGNRRIVLVTGGRFDGDRIGGRLLLGGTDVQRIREDGVAELCIHAALETNEGERVLLKGRGLRHAPPLVAHRLAAGEDVDPSLYYFREAITFETDAPRLSWLNRILAVGTGRRTRDRVELEVFQID